MRRSRRERLTLIRIFEELRGIGYQGSYDAVRRYAKKWRVERGAATAEAYVPLSFAPGEAYQFDWSQPRRLRPVSVCQPRQRVHHFDVELDLLANAGAHDLDYSLLAVEQLCGVHLGNRGGGKRRVVEAC